MNFILIDLNYEKEIGFQGGHLTHFAEEFFNQHTRHLSPVVS